MTCSYVDCKELALGRVSAQRDEIKSARPSKVICLSDIVSDVDGSHSKNGLLGIHPIVVTASDFAAFFELSRPRGRLSDTVGRLANSGKRGSGT
jgi:hypothetical protein